MTPRRAITPPDCRASLRAVKPLRFAPTPFGAGGLDGPSGPPRIGIYVMAGTHPATETHENQRKEKTMLASRITPSIEVTIGRETRLYHAFITTAPTRLDAPATLTLHTAPFSDVSALAADPFTFDPTSAKSSARLVLVDATELYWQRARYREERHLFASADPVLVGLNTLQHWLWNRIGSPATDLELANA
jgi:hypothetical protein